MFHHDDAAIDNCCIAQSVLGCNARAEFVRLNRRDVCRRVFGCVWVKIRLKSTLPPHKHGSFRSVADKRIFRYV